MARRWKAYTTTPTERRFKTAVLSALISVVDIRYGTQRGDGGTGTCYVPAAGDVEAGVNVDATVGTFASPSVGKVLNDTSYGADESEFTGTYAAISADAALYTGSGYYGEDGLVDGNYYGPSAQSGVTTATTYGVGNATSGTLNMDLYTLRTGVAAAADVRKGVARYSGGDNGTLVGCVDSAGVNQGASGVLSLTSVYTATGHFDGTSVTAVGLWTLISGVAGTEDVREGTLRYTGGGVGALAVPNPSDVRFGVDTDDTTGTLIGVVDNAGVWHAYGTCDSSKVWAIQGIIHTSGTAATSGILTSGGGYYATGLLISAGSYYATGWWDGASYEATPDFPDVGNVTEDDTVDGVTGTYHEAAAAEVQWGVMFAAASAVMGTYSIGGTYVEGRLFQAAADQVSVGAVAGSILTTVTGLLGTVNGTYVAPVQAGYSALAAGYGAGGGTTGTLAAAKIHDATYGTLADGSVLVAAGGTYVDPNDAEVKLGTAIGVSPRAGTWDAVAKTDVVAAAWVVTGNNNYVGGSAGTYPTTATSQAAQLATDQAVVDAAKAGITTTTTILGVTGTLNLGLYALISGIVAVGDVRLGTARYTGGTTGTWDAVSKTDIVAASWVVAGHDNYAGGDAGSYPTTATTEAAQHATDAAFLEANKDEIITTDTDILAEFGVTGTAIVSGGVDPNDIILPATDLVDAPTAYGYPSDERTGTGLNLATLTAALSAAGLTLPGGTYTQTVTVTSGGVALQGAVVDILSGTTLIDSQTTNALGVATPSCNAGTYTLRVSYPGLYVTSSTTIVVTVAAARAVSLTAITVAPSATGFVTGYWTCYGINGAVEASTTHYLQVCEGAGTTGVSTDTTKRTAVSAANGLVSFTGIPWGASVYVWRGTSDVMGPFVAPLSGTTWAMDEVLGTP